MWFVNCEVAARPMGRICIGRYQTRQKAYDAIPELEKEYPAYTRFTVNTKPRL